MFESCCETELKKTKGRLPAAAITLTPRSDGIHSLSTMRMPPVVASRLRATDVRHFAGDSTFHQVARAVCTADAAIARKELPECWAMAERIHDELLISSR